MNPHTQLKLLLAGDVMIGRLLNDLLDRQRQLLRNARAARGTTSTGYGACRTTFIVTLPGANRLSPL